MRWVNEECNEDLADSGSGRVLETERLYLVLVDVGEGDTATSDGFDTSKFLKTVVAPELQPRRSYVFAVIVL